MLFSALLGPLLAPTLALAQPTITALSPVRNARTAPVSTNVGITFDQPMSGSAVSLGSVKVFAQQSRGLMRDGQGGAASVSGNTLTFNPTNNFKPGETVFVTTTPAAMATNGSTLARGRVHQFTAATGGSGRGVFTGGSDVAVTDTPTGVAVADVDGDGDLDLLATDYAPNGTVIVRLNGGDATGSNTGVFGGGSSVPVGDAPWSVTVGDVDGDGDLDLLTANQDDNTVSVRINGGDASGSNTGVFSNGSDVPVGSGPLSVAVGDVDGDGDLDFVTANFGGNTVSVRLNGGDATGSNTGVFSNGSNVAVGSRPFNIAVGDLDGDGDLDLLVANQSGTTVSVRLNGGDASGSNTGVFSNGSNVAVGSNPTGVAVADVDGDGDLDLLAANSGSNTVSVRLNGGNATGSNTGVFSNGSTVAVGSEPYSVAVGDVDADGDLDLLAVNRLNNTVSVRLNGGDATGSNTAVFSGGSTVPAGSNSISVTVGDVDGDGDLDLLAANSSAGTVSVRLNYALVPVVTALAPSRNARNAATSSDVNITFDQPMSASAASAASVKVFSQQRGGRMSGTQGGAASVSGNTITFNPTTNFKPGETVFVTTTTAAQSSGGASLAAGKVHQFTAATGGTGEGNFVRPLTPGVISSNGAGNPNHIAVGDVDGDGDLDFVTADAGTTTVSVLVNDDVGGFAPHATNPYPGVLANPRFVTLGDVDGDGDLDFVIPSPTANGVSVRLNDGTGSFTSSAAAPDFTGLDLPTVTRLADVDADGDLDLLLNNRTTLSVRFNNGSGNFSAGADFGLGAAATGGLSVGDLDSDGDIDAAVSTVAGIQVFHNSGGGAFSFVQNVGQPRPIGVQLADFDGDGDLDMATGVPSLSLLTIRLNLGNGTFAGGSDVSLLGQPLNQLEIGDVDADGDIDLIAPPNDFFANVLINDGNGGFAPYAPNPQPTLDVQAQSVALGDFDADGDLDLLAGSAAPPGKVSLRLNTVAPVALTAVAPTRHQRNVAPAANVVISFSEPMRNSVATAGAVRVFSHQFGGRMSGVLGGTATVSGNTITFDPTNNFRPGEMVSVTTTPDAQSTTGTFIVRGHVHQFTVGAAGGPGGFSMGQNLTVSANTAPALASGDVDGDGAVDLVTINLASGPGTGVGVYLNSRGILAPHPTNPTSLVSVISVGDLELADMDGDGDLDLLIGQRNAVLVMTNDGAGVFTLAQTQGVFGSITRLAVGDFDGNGSLDVVTTADNGRLNVLLNNGTGTLGFPVPYVSGGRSYGVAVGDIDLDGDLDLVATNQNSGNSTIILRNNGAGNFGLITPTTTFGPRTGVALADMDGDGDLDLLTAVSGSSGTVAVQLNDGSGTFGAVSQSVPVGNTPEGITTADFNGDGAPDLLVSNVLGNSLSVRLNNGTGTFATTGDEIAVGSQTRKPVAVDLDNDGDLDVLAAGLFNNRVITRFNGPLDLLVDNTQPVPGGTYRNINVTNGGDGTLTGNVTVMGTLQINLSSRLNDGCFRITGPGNFVLRAGGALSICDPAGISPTGATGAVQVTGTRSFSADATYRYNGTTAQVTGAGLPATVRELAVQNPAGVSLSQAVGISTALRLSAGTLTTNGQNLTLLSTAARTAYAVHAGGTTSGAVRVQRFVGGPSAAGYRHLSAPVQNTTVADLSTAGFTAFVNSAYNAIPAPALPTTQFPNVFGFDETRGGAVPNFTLGYFSPTRLTDPLTPGRGWSVLMSGGRTPDFVGTLTSGNVPLTSLTRTGNFSGAGEKSGWHLLGNPYPQPIDWDLATASIPAGMSGAISVYRTTGGANGTYLTRTNGLGSLPDGVVPLGQAFFAQVTAPGPVSFTFTDALRVEANPATVARPAPETRPVLSLTLTKAGTPAETDETFVYIEPGATLGSDDHFDGFKPAHNVGLPTLATLIGSAEAAVNGLPESALTQPTTIELLAILPTPGTYELRTNQLQNFDPTTTTTVLLDRLTGTRYPLTAQPIIHLTATRANEEIRARFALELNGNRILHTAPLTPATPTIILWPNPATNAVQLTATPHTPAELLDATGRLIRRTTTDETGSTVLSLTDVPAGVYLVRCGSQTKRLVVK